MPIRLNNILIHGNYTTAAGGRSRVVEGRKEFKIGLNTLVLFRRRRTFTFNITHHLRWILIINNVTKLVKKFINAKYEKELGPITSIRLRVAQVNANTSMRGGNQKTILGEIIPLLVREFGVEEACSLMVEPNMPEPANIHNILSTEHVSFISIKVKIQNSSVFLNFQTNQRNYTIHISMLFSVFDSETRRLIDVLDTFEQELFRAWQNKLTAQILEK